MPACPLQGCGQGRPSWAGTQDEQPEVSFSEEAVNEVKRQAMSELQKAVSDAERKAHELISTERAKMERALAEARRQASEDALTVVNQQEDSSEVRPAGCRSGKGFRSEGGSRHGGRGRAEVHVGPETDSCLRGKREWFREAWHLRNRLRADQLLSLFKT